MLEIVRASAVVVVLLSASCSGEKGLVPPRTEPDHRRFEWVVITDSYVPARAIPGREGATTAILRAWDILPVLNIEVAPVTVHAETGRWFLLAIDGAGEGWVFESSFRGFYSYEQASRFRADEMP